MSCSNSEPCYLKTLNLQMVQPLHGALFLLTSPAMTCLEYTDNVNTKVGLSNRVTNALQAVEWVWNIKHVFTRVMAGSYQPGLCVYLLSNNRYTFWYSDRSWRRKHVRKNDQWAMYNVHCSLRFTQQNLKTKLFKLWLRLVDSLFDAIWTIKVNLEINCNFIL